MSIATRTGDDRMTAPSVTRNIRRILIGFWVVLWMIVPALILFPIGSKPIRAATLVGVCGICLGTLALFWRNKRVRIACVIVAVAVAAALGLPGRALNKNSLQAACVRSLRNYEGTPYVWGGENSFGIDCSGLVRRGLIDANLKCGIRSLNPGHFREALSMWWFDSSARALRDGFRNMTTTLQKARSINALDHSPLQPGDFAITADGVHALAYLGENTWIEADPNKMRVMVVRVPAKDNGWFNVPVVIMRWKQLQ